MTGSNGFSDTIKATLIPLLPLSLRHPTPENFGDPLTIGGWSDSRDTWLHVVPVRFMIPMLRPVSGMLLIPAPSRLNSLTLFKRMVSPVRYGPC
jgi:hypothetical protein